MVEKKKIGIYDSKVCKNSRLERPINGKLEVEFVKYCTWCGTAHSFYLKEVVEE